MGDDVLKEIAIELTKAIRSCINVDWSVRESVQKAHGDKEITQEV